MKRTVFAGLLLGLMVGLPVCTSCSDSPGSSDSGSASKNASDLHSPTGPASASGAVQQVAGGEREASGGGTGPVGKASAGMAPIRIGVAWEGQAKLQTRVSQGLVETLQAKAPQIQIEWQRELPSLEALDQVAKRFEKEKAGMVLLRSSGAEYLAAHPPRIPSFIGGCNHPAEIGTIKNINAPEGNVTGVTYALSYDDQFRTFKALLPQMDSILLLVEDKHPGSAIDRAGTQAATTKLKIRYSEKLCRTKEDVLTAIREAKGKVSAIILGNQALVFDDAGPVVAAAAPTPVLAYTSKPVTEGVLCGLTADDVKLGRLLAECIIDVLVKGKAVRDVPVRTDTEPRLYVNVSTAEKIGVTIPVSILSVAEVVK